VLATVLLTVAGKPVPVLLRKWHLKIKSRIFGKTAPEQREQGSQGRVLVEEASRPFNFARELMLRAAVIPGRE